MKAITLFDNKTPIFERTLKARHYDFKETTWFKVFLLKAQKVLIDMSEFEEWSQDNFQNEVSDQYGVDGALYTENFKELKLQTPFDKLWVEFFNLKDWHSAYMSTHDAFGNEISIYYGVGYDLSTNELLALRGVKIPGSNTCAPYPVRLPLYKDSDPSILLYAVTNYLQTEYINAVSRSFTHGTRFRKGRPISHVSPYMVVYRKQPVKKTEQDESYAPGQVDWQHRWRVKGHWRKVKGTGKDFDGNPIEGFTWVRECVKGPEDKPLVEKTRIVRDALPRHYQEVRV